MNEKKSKVMSLSLEKEMQELLEKSAKKMGVSRSQLVRELVDTYLDVVVNKSEQIPVVLQIPVALKGNPIELKKWLDTKVEVVLKALS